MIDIIRQIFGETTCYNDLMLLTSKLISLEQIIEDL